MVKGDYKESSTKYHTECHGLVVDTPALYLGDTGFKFWPREWLF